MVLHRNQKLNLLRIVVLLTVALAGLKFFFRDSFTLDQRKDTSGESGFWGKAGELKQSAKPWDGLPALLETKVAAAGQESRKQPVWDFSTTQMRLVHLDLKGAAPKVSYLEQVFPLFSKLGANGILIEYEDMFPFKGELEVLKSPYAYSEEDVERIQNLAEINKLEVIPLVQTFGHVEFILKHDKYRHLREVERFPNSFNPHVPETLAVLKALITQVLSKHRRSSWVHIGADEVFHLGEGMDSKNWLSRNAGDVGKMFLNHIREVVDFIASQDWGFQVLMWDDMLRKVSVAAVQDSGIAQHASPMLWFYAPNFDAQQIGKYVSKYAECGFKTIWFASAFKGTTGPAQAWTPLHHHLQNHLQWLSVMRSVAKAPSTRLQGIALTGWQRYDHYSALCELLPVGIPSLAVCLQTLVNGGFNEAAKKKVLEILGFQSLQLEKSTCVGSGAFPGLDIYRMVEQVNSQLKDSVLKVLEEESSIKGWFSPYHRKHLFGNQHATHAERAYRQAKKCIKVHEDWENFIQTLRSHMEAVYFPDTVEEWMEENVNPHLDRLREFVRDFREVIRLNARPKKTL
ncbi:hexosaminidase D-like isoform X1 [Sphaerodactylus townsendi]|uniref:hexosaminidase D-like isoform X1 n=1 Tax=Sphaerodactylus townsendi TaxID=933632 RepID=UPI0020268EF5|nr:hexosaminidase D-like isoform X1 [Sphaerodactylus townsendi]XP_048351544.1 hexosaminidase D-like isoform X1 [Sphaerodactylus townsendi]XP_048351546.1 hexosaminidase D-like isoform X1 [Sphaerodactylus townsendi]XP_048351547.1 hexosaminidase D-like isoform X1 [Sphaerodactylus townsendi]XP_048351548.1 hexosaminidase D-like isoform X1 [Sphaerodactylus townsendi]